MSGALNSIMMNAASGLKAAAAEISVLSDNIANAGVVGFTAKKLDVATFEVGGQSNGVRTGQVSSSVDAAVQASVWSAASSVGAATVQSQVMQAINATQGTPGDGGSLADAVSALHASFTQMQAQPSAQAQQSAVVAAAATLANAINSTANTIASERNSVQTQIVSSVDAFNSALATVASTTKQIMAAVASNGNVADLEDQRGSALKTMSGLLDLHVSKQADGDISILGQNGISIPLDGKFVTQSASLTPADSYAPHGTAVPPVLLQSSNPTIPPSDVTSQLTGGQLGQLIQLRDTTLPAYTASLDAFSAKLANQFSMQGLQLFTNGSATTPLASDPGLSSLIQVNQAVVASPSLVRDGTTGAANPSGLAGFTGVIDNVLGATFTAAPGATTLLADAQSFVSRQSVDTATAAANLTNTASYQTTVSSALSNGSGVNVDQQMGLMIQLQNSYQANARLIETTTNMFNVLLAALAPTA